MTPERVHHTGCRTKHAAVWQTPGELSTSESHSNETAGEEQKANRFTLFVHRRTIDAGGGFREFLEAARELWHHLLEQFRTKQICHSCLDKEVRIDDMQGVALA